MTCDRCAVLEAELRQYRLREVFGVTPNVARLLNALYVAYPKGRSGRGLLNATRRKDHAKPGTDNLTRVYVHHARQIVGPGGIELRSGIYRLTEQGRADLDEMIA